MASIARISAVVMDSGRKEVGPGRRWRVGARPGTIGATARVAVCVAVAMVAVALGAGPAAASAPAPDSRTARFEVDFLKGMIDHHHMAVMMSDLCLQKRDEGQLTHAGKLGQLCKSITSTQNAEIRRMQAWLQDWYGISYGPMMMPGDMEMMDDLAALKGAEFEIAFLEMMVEHHRQAVVEARPCTRRADHEELRGLCEGIIASQTAEIAQMRGWLCQWYDRCRGGMQAA